MLIKCSMVVLCKYLLYFPWILIFSVHCFLCHSAYLTSLGAICNRADSVKNLTPPGFEPGLLVWQSNALPHHYKSHACTARQYKRSYLHTTVQYSHIYTVTPVQNWVISFPVERKQKVCAIKRNFSRSLVHRNTNIKSIQTKRSENEPECTIWNDPTRKITPQ